ncbi:hypothetical protein H0H81_001898 [Sphagnurus paluster]|uniref:Trafficking protein particle complex II-specific subunit 65 IgD3 domain-containing protein n=1 Tax=Sphagnurus paluster TaxID=117069 RepID=A0A9P7GNA0_9AGAR|nr:hypothetical protein H0H81_001898 [Sphagnurus paluster]
MAFEQLFASSVLNLAVPDTSVEFPPEGSADEWLRRLHADSVERKQAFFDEQLQAFLTVRLEHPPSSPPDPENPPQIILTLLAHTQVSLEATYISAVPAPNPDPIRTSKLSAPPRTAPLGKSHTRLQANPHHPSILPPSTPNPTPSSADHDRRYVTSEGTLLLASIWGQSTSEECREGFALIWSEREQAWFAMYRISLALPAAFLRLNFLDPLLCLTVSVTLRDKPVTLAQPKHPLAEFFANVGAHLPTTPESPTTPNRVSTEHEEHTFNRLEEVNLLEGLQAGPTFAKADSNLNLPSTRLGTVSRQKLFSLLPVSLPTPTTPSPSPMTAVRTAHPTLRKSYRKTLQTVSGFRVRMRTVFVPYVLLPESEPPADLDEAEDERERREAGNEERTVVLCVEVENSGDSGSGIGFMVEKVEVSIGGEGAKATLIGWGDGCFRDDVESKTFPLRIGAMAQYNLLYAVSFLRAPEEVEGFSLTRDQNNPERPSNAANPELQRAVAINIFGKPYAVSTLSEELSYPTATFSSRWNCVLDLSPHQNHTIDPLEGAEDLPSALHALPEPASPFPSNTPRTANFVSPGIYSTGSTPQSATAGSKRHTLPANIVAARSIRATAPHRANSMLNPGTMPVREREQPPLPGAASRMSYAPPSASAPASQIPRSPTTYGTPPPPPLPQEINEARSPGGHAEQMAPPPMTPAYPSYPPLSAVPPTPFSQGPITSHNTGNIGPSIEIRRERGVGMSGVPVPQTPGPWVGGFGEQKQKALARLQPPERPGESIVVSVGLLPLEEWTRLKTTNTQGVGPGKIYPLDYFTLDIFVFNQSDWTRRFEVTCPMRRARRRAADAAAGGHVATLSGVAKQYGYPGILPMDARVRIGPLRPSACQSVRMEFLAITPGVHPIDALTLTDVESGFSVNLRSVMDIVVHDPSD